MQAYQSAPCPYCGATWKQPGAQACANCRNRLPPPQPGYAPPGYAPAPPQGYPQMPQSYPGAPSGYPGQPTEQAPSYPGYAPPGYPQAPGYPQQPDGYGPPPGYPGYAPRAAPAAGPASTTLRLFGQPLTRPVALPRLVVRYPQALAH